MTKQDKIKKVMDEFKRGTLKTPDGRVVKNRKQALAIAMSESEDYAEKGELIHQLSIGSVEEAIDILKSAGTIDEELFEKAKHQDGDMHPNGKWVWVASANGGKGDWRTAGGRAHKKHQAGSSVTSENTSKKTSEITKPTAKNTQSQSTDDIQFEIDWDKSSNNIDYDTKKLFIAILDKYRKSRNSGNKTTSFSDVAYDYLVQGGHDDDEATDLSYELEDIFNKVVEIKSQPKQSNTPKAKQKKLRPVGTGTNGPERRRKTTTKKSKYSEMSVEDLGKLKGKTLVKEDKMYGGKSEYTITGVKKEVIQ